MKIDLSIGEIIKIAALAVSVGGGFLLGSRCENKKVPTEPVVLKDTIVKTDTIYQTVWDTLKIVYHDTLKPDTVWIETTRVETLQPSIWMQQIVWNKPVLWVDYYQDFQRHRLKKGIKVDSFKIEVKGQELLITAPQYSPPGPLDTLWRDFDISFLVGRPEQRWEGSVLIRYKRSLLEITYTEGLGLNVKGGLRIWTKE